MVELQNETQFSESKGLSTQTLEFQNVWKWKLKNNLR
jgi:hypothetical protein